MAKPISGTLLIPEFINTNVGEYSFENATYSTVYDENGNGAFDVAVGQVLYIPAASLNTGLSIPGVLHRYKLTTVTVLDTFTVSGTLLWDEGGDEQDAPISGSNCLLAQATDINKIGLPPVDDDYSGAIPAGSTMNALLVDVRNIIDKLSIGNLPSDNTAVIADVENLKTRVTDIETNLIVMQEQINQASKVKYYTHYQTTDDVTWIVQHNQGSVAYVCSIFSPIGDLIIPDRVNTVDANTVVVTLSKPSTGTATLILHK
jgi:hypothetical protein